MNQFLSSLPILVLVVALTIFKLKAWKAAALSFAVGLSLACVRGLTATTALTAIHSGVTTGLCPIGFVIVAALFTYTITVESRQMEVIKQGLAGLFADTRLLILLIVWGFGNFMEGMAGFGTAVAIPCAILVGVGFSPFKAVLCCLVANTTATTFGSVGVPAIILANETGLEVAPLVRATATLQIIVTAMTPFLILFVADGWRGIREQWRFALLADGAFLIPALIVAATLGPELPDVVGGLSVMITLGLCGNRKSFRFHKQFYAWAPFGIVVGLLAITCRLPSSCKPTPGAVILFGALTGGLVQRIKITRLFQILGETIYRYATAILTICLVLALAKTMDAAGMIADLAHALVALTGPAYAFFSTCVGALGGFMTGSGTSTCVLFGKLQSSVGAESGHSLIFAAANVMGAGIGKMICPQSIVLGCAAAGLAGKESHILGRIFPYFLLLLAIACLVVGLVGLYR